MRKGLMAASLVVLTAMCGAAVSAAADGKELYAKCQGCHGADGGKFLKSKAEGDVLKALNGYKAREYGGDKKTMMENIAAKLSAEDIQALAQYISKL